jgi:glycosyltransferase involved in cell wall biosynthesis
MRKDFLWTYNPLTTQVIHYKRFKKVIYHCVDEIKAQPGMPVVLLESAEKELVSRADIVFVTAPKLLETRREWNPNTHYLPNVADYDHFSKALDPATIIPADIEQIPAPRIGFIGAISGYKIDFDLIRFVAQSRPDWSIVLIGKIGEGDPWTDSSTLSGLSNIYLLGPRSYMDLPGYLKAFDVALLPNRLNDYTESMFPMKFFEYLAAGKIVVSVDLLSLQEFKDTVLIAKTPAEFVKQIEAALDGKGLSLEKRLELARAYTYESRTEKMMQLLVTLK